MAVNSIILISLLFIYVGNSNTIHSASADVLYSRDNEDGGQRQVDVMLDEHKRNSRQADESRPLIITTILSEPFVMAKRDQPVGGNSSQVWHSTNDRYEGYCIDLMALLAEKLDNAHYYIKLVNDSRYGAVDEDGKWNGMIGELLRGEADLAVAPLTIHKERAAVVDFSQPFMTAGLSIMLKKPEKHEYGFLSSISTNLWISILIAYLVVSVVGFLVGRFSPYTWRVHKIPQCMAMAHHGCSCGNCLFSILGGFVHVGINIKSVLGRVAFFVWWFLTIFIVASYIASLVPLFAFREPLIESVEDLVRSNIKYGVQSNGSTAKFFQHSTVSLYQQMWQKMTAENPTVFVTNYAEGIRRVRESRGQYALLLESPTNDLTNLRAPCDTMKVQGRNLNSIGYGVATPFGSPLRDKINQAILELQERGELRKLEDKWWYDRGECEPVTRFFDVGPARSRILNVLYANWGILFGILFAIGEFLYIRSKRRSQEGERLYTFRAQAMNEAKA